MFTGKIFLNNKHIGNALFNEDEKNHFDYAPIVAAKCALTSDDIKRLCIDDDDYINIAFD
jgi:hypothetical protein